MHGGWKYSSEESANSPQTPSICSITAKWMYSSKISSAICGCAVFERVISSRTDHAKILCICWNWRWSGGERRIFDKRRKIWFILPSNDSVKKNFRYKQSIDHRVHVESHPDRSYWSITHPRRWPSTQSSTIEHGYRRTICVRSSFDSFIRMFCRKRRRRNRLYTIWPVRSFTCCRTWSSIHVSDPFEKYLSVLLILFCQISHRDQRIELSKLVQALLGPLNLRTTWYLQQLYWSILKALTTTRDEFSCGFYHCLYELAHSANDLSLQKYASQWLHRFLQQRSSYQIDRDLSDSQTSELIAEFSSRHFLITSPDWSIWNAYSMCHCRVSMISLE